jgi:peptidyl-prolyl cis-trans isomerase D
MLQFIRDRATGWIAWFIIILICVPFALWGVQEYISPSGSLAVAEVNDTEIGYYEFQNAFQQQRRQIERMLGQRLSGVEMERRLREETLERLIRDEVLVQTAVDGGLRVGDGQLAEAIRALPAFGGESGFTQDAYEAFLRSQGLSSQGFESDLRRSMLSEQVAAAIQRSELVTRAEVDRYWRHQNALRHYRRLVVDPQALEVVEPDENAIAEYYRAHEQSYVRPLHVKLAYIEVSRDAIAAGVPVEEQELRAIYESTSQNYRTAEQRAARHILVQLPREADDAAVAAGRDTILALRRRIEDGEDFAEVAREASEDPGSASEGGALPTFGRGIMDPAFEEAAFGLEPEVLSEPVRSSFGWHLIEVTEVQPERVRTFDEARDDIELEYRTGQAEQIYAAKVDELANLAFENPDSLEPASQALDVSIQSSAFFSRDGEGATGVALFPAVREAAFSLEVVEEGANSELIQLAPGRVAVVRVEEQEKARPLSLEEARDAVRATLLAEARAEKAAEVGKAVLAQLEGGEGLDSAASSQGLSFEAAAQASPASPGVLDLEARRRLFAMPAPESRDSPEFVGLAMGEGGFQVLALLDIESPASGPDAQQRLETQQRLRGAIGSQAFEAVMRGLRDRAEVRVLEDNLTADSF